MIKAKEKAQELMNEFRHYIYPFRAGSGYLTGDIDEEVIKNNSRHCASIAVDEIISQLAIINNDESFNISKYGNYWQEVKEELKKL